MLDDDDMPTEMIIENNNAFLMAMGEGSRIEIHAADAEKTTYTQLAVAANRNSNTITVEDATGWEVGDKIAIAGTNRFNQQHEEFTITDISADGKTFTLDGALAFNHMAETRSYDNGLTGVDRNEWDVEMRAEVSLLSRNVTIQGDADSVNDGFGAHTMVMDGAEQHISGAEFTMVGQMNILGRYPIHWHLIGDAEGQYVTNSSIHHSYQKGSTIHGTSNVLYEDNVIFDHIGHGVFMEDGAETGNQILGNLVFGTKRSETGEPIPTDQEEVTSYWIENPENILIGNVAAGSEGHGYWIFRHDEVHGDSADLFPGQNGDFSKLIFQDNTAHSIRMDGLSVGGAVDAETLEALRGANERVTPDAKFAEIDGFTAYMIGDQGIWLSARDVVIEDTAVVDARQGYRPNIENHIVDSLVAETQQGVRLYRSGGNTVDGVHFEDNQFDIQNFGSAHFTLSTGFRDVTSDGPITFQHQFDTPAATDEINSQHVNIDIDGSITGTPGAFFTPGTATSNMMRTSPDAVFDAEHGFWISETTIASTKIFVGNQGRNADLVVVRSDGLSEDGFELSRPDLFEDDRSPRFEIPAATGMERDVAYLIDFDVVPRDLTFDLRNARNDESVIYEIANIASFDNVTGAQEVGSFDALVGSDTTAYFHNGSSLFVKMVALYDGSTQERPVDDLAAAYRTQDIVSIEGVTNGGAAAPHGRRDLSPDLIESIEQAPAREVTPLPFVRQAQAEPNNDGFVLDRYESTSQTEDVTDNMPRWSEAATWDQGVPGADEIVVIGPGKTVVLNQSTTVKGIIVNGGNLIVEDGPSGPANEIMLIADYVLVINGGLFQAGTEDDPIDRDFTLELTGDDPDFDLNVTSILQGEVANVTNVIAEPPADGLVYVSSGVELSESQSVIAVADTAATGRFDAVFDPETRELTITGAFSDLASDVTMMHLHSGAAGQTGGVVQALSVTSADGRNGSFEGSFILSEAEAAQYLAGETYVNLHTVDAPGGALRGQALPGELQEPPGSVTDPGPTLGSLSGQIVDATGAGVAAALLVLLDANGDTVASTMSRPDGSYDFEFLIPGQYQVRATESDLETPLINVAAGQDAIAAGLILQTQPVDPVETHNLGDGDDQFNGGASADAVNGDGGEDVIWGLGGADALSGGDGADIVRGGQGDDTVYGDAGGDIVSGDRGADYVDGGGGADVVRGGAGDDQVFGRAGDDAVVSGDAGNDMVYGGDGDDVVRGGSGDDVGRGGNGDDRVIGDIGDDQLFGDQGDDVLIGHLGDDYLIGGEGFDRLIGGDGADVYAFEAGGGRDVLVGFQAGVDKIDISAYDGLSAEQVLNQAAEAPAGGVTLDFGDGDSAVLRDVELTDLSAGDFIVS